MLCIIRSLNYLLSKPSNLQKWRLRGRCCGQRRRESVYDMNNVGTIRQSETHFVETVMTALRRSRTRKDIVRMIVISLANGYLKIALEIVSMMWRQKPSQICIFQNFKK